LQEKDLKLLFEAGILKACSVTKAMMNDNAYELCIEKKSGEAVALETQRGGVRQFKDIGSAINTASKIGFKIITVRLI
jgi:hypothetical protein